MTSWLTPAGAAAAALVGAAVAAGAGWRGLALLAAFLASSSVLTRGGGRRTPAQVLANGGVAALAALLALTDRTALVALAGALAAATADTWSTEIGGRSAARPRLITTGRRVAPGTSGGITLLGTAGGLTGAAFLAAAAVLIGMVPPDAGPWVLAAGVGGGLADSLLGATLQARYRCSACAAVGETPRCACGGETRLASGLGWLTNDAVNISCTLAGAAIACLPAAAATLGLG